MEITIKIISPINLKLASLLIQITVTYGDKNEDFKFCEPLKTNNETHPDEEPDSCSRLHQGRKC